MDNVSIVVEDIDAAIAFFAELAMELEGRMTVEGAWAGRVVGLDHMKCEIAMMRMPDGHGRIELTMFLSPTATAGPKAVNTVGFHRVMFAVKDIEEVLARLRTHGAKLVGGLEQYEDSYRLCYVRGPAGIIIGLAEQLT
jgi:catechol 2,3-dioxygenase-like lactoylglutathione lyase family enzyme